jgi:hypothetical protein
MAITTHGPSPSISQLTCIPLTLTFICPPGRGWKYSADGRHLTAPTLVPSSDSTVPAGCHGQPRSDNRMAYNSEEDE